MTWLALRHGVAAFIVCAPSPAHAMLAVALAAHGARLGRTHVEHDGRKLRVAICDVPTRPGEVSEGFALAYPMRAALDVLVACREHGTPLDSRTARARARLAGSGEKVEKKVAPRSAACKRRSEAPQPGKAATPLLPKGGEFR